MSLRERTWYPILFMFIITLGLSAVIILFGSITRPRVKENERLSYERAVLQALPIDLPVRPTPSRIHEIYVTNVQEANEYSAGALRHIKDDSLVAYALPLAGPGFWAPIKGVIGIAADRRTVTGIAFYEQNETPGLGGEIIKAPFRTQFKGKKIALQGAPLKILPVTAELDESSVHAITGATQTSSRLGQFMNEQLVVWRERISNQP